MVSKLLIVSIVPEDIWVPEWLDIKVCEQDRTAYIESWCDYEQNSQ